MIDLQEIRKIAMKFPEVSEGSHFKLPAFKVRDKTFVVIQKGNTHSILSVNQEEAEAASTADPEACKVIWRNSGRIFVGVRVDLAKISEVHVNRLIEQAWRNKALKRLVTQYDDDLN